MVYDTEDPTRIAQMNDEMRAIESMVIVGVLKYTAAGKEHGNWRDSAAGFGVTLRCHSARDHGACGKRAVGPVRLNSTTRTTLLDCLTELRRKLQEEHGSCIKEREKRIKEILNKEIPKAKPGNWACVQARELWSTEEEVHFRPGHHWLCELGDAGDGTSCEKKFELGPRQWEDYKGTRFYNGDQALVIKRWLNRVDEDASGLTFEEWDPASEADTSQEPVAMIINSSELRAAGFKLKEVLPPQLESAARGGMRTRGAGLRRLQGMGPQRFLLHVDDDTEFRSRCE